MSSFEKDIQSVFEGAEFQPSDRVWAGVEASLTAKKKKGIFFLWQTYGIAAGIAVVLSFGFLYNEGYFNGSEVLPTKDLSEAEETQKDANADEDKVEGTTNDPQPEKDPINNSEENEQALRADLNNSENEPNTTSQTDLVDPTTSGRSTLALQTKTNEPETVSEGIKDLAGIDRTMEIESATSESSLNSFSDLIIADLKPYRNSLAANILMWNAKLEMSSMETPSVASNFDEKPSFEGQRSLNGSLGNSVMNLSAGSSSNSMNVAELRDPSNFSSLNASVESGEDQALGAISAGFGLTLDLNRKLSMNIGVRYAEFRFRNSSNAYSVENGVSLPVYAPLGFDPTNVFFVGEYELENTIQTMFLQTTFNYKLVSFGKFDVAMKAGIGIDYFLSYKVKGELNFLETRKVNPSESSFLNRTNISGITGLGINYRINSQFGLSGDISYRKFITTNPGDTNSEASSVVGFGISLNYFLNRKEE